MRRKRKFAIAEYSAMAVGLLGAVDISAQAVYVDVEPDYILDEHLEWYYLDMDENGINDFQFFNVSYYHEYTYYEQNSEFRQRIWAGVQGTFANGIAARFQSITFGPDRYYPYVLSSDEIVNNDINFGYWINQRMALRGYDSVILYGETIYLTSKLGKWFPPVVDKYLGIKFKAEDEKMHYGWIRCDAIDENVEGLTLIIKDYAYESKPNVPIAAGDTIGDTTHFIVDASDYENAFAEVYSFNKTIYCIIPSEYLECLLTIYSITGEKLYTEKLKQEKTEIEFSKYSVGVYVVEMMSGENRFRKKVVIE